MAIITRFFWPFLLLLTIIGGGYWIYTIRQSNRKQRLQNMTEDELVDAIIDRKISILEVPPQHRDAVDRRIQELRKELDQL